MNKHKFLLIGIAATFFAASCKKQDLQADNEPVVPAAPTVEWKAAPDWSSSKEENYTSYSTAIQDKSITAEVVDNGLVLAFAKYGNDVFSLPHESKGVVDAAWHYQVSENTIAIDVDVYSDKATIDNKQTFNYFILTADKIKSLEENGHPMSELITLTYENAKNLLK